MVEIQKGYVPANTSKNSSWAMNILIAGETKMLQRLNYVQLIYWKQSTFGSLALLLRSVDKTGNLTHHEPSTNDFLAFNVK